MDMDKLVALCRRRGFIFQSSEIYGGINGFWDYGPLGVELKRNIKDAWWHDMVHNPPPGPDGEGVYPNSSERLGAQIHEPLHAFDPAHRRGELFAELVAQLGSGMHRTRVDVAHHRWIRVGDRHAVQYHGELRGSRCHQRRVKCTADVQWNRSPCASCERQRRSSVHSRA